MSKKLAYIATPYKAIITARPDLSEGLAKSIAVRIAQRAARYVHQELGYAPVSPVLALSCYDELDTTLSEEARNEERAAAVSAGLALLEACDVFILVDGEYTQYSEGMKAEQQRAQELGKRIEIIGVMGYL